MKSQLLLELIGYAASALIAVSLMMSSILRLRVLNLAGAGIFSLYGLMIGALPVAVLNGFIVLVNGFHLWRMLRAKEFFQILPVQPNSVYLSYFLEFHHAQIERILPGFQYEPGEDKLALFVLRDCAPVGVFLARREGSGRVRVLLDFVIPGYRDFKLGRFLFEEQAGFFRSRGVSEIVITPRTREFGAYLQKVGFEPLPASHGTFRLRYESGAV
jgi:GNAT superfamily N-acetyltransferase